MKTHVTPFEFTDYRQFLREAIKSRGHSYLSFADKYDDIISFATLAAALSRGKGGLKSRPARNISPELLAKLGAALRLKNSEIDFLIALRHENDAELLPGVGGDAIRESALRMVRLLNSLKLSASLESESESPLAVSLGALVEQFSDSGKKRICKIVLLEAQGVLSRQRKKAGLNKLLNSIATLRALQKQL